MNKDNPTVLDLELIYRETLHRCAPERLIRGFVTPDLPRHVVAIGKCAGPLFDGFAAVVDVESGFVVVPRGYPPPRSAGGDTRAPNVIVMAGGHPDIDRDSFEAGYALLRYLPSHSEMAFLISGGGSACVEVPLRPFFSEDDVAAANRRVVAAGIPIAEMNTVRKHLSAIKGGRLAAAVRGRSVSLIYSDVATGDLASVASGPTLPDPTTRADAIRILEQVGECDRIVTALRDESLPETVKEIGNTTAVCIADNATLVATAATLIADAGWRPVTCDQQLERDVAAEADELARRAARLQPGEVLIAGGEPTVVVRGKGRGGRCLELAIRFALARSGENIRLSILFGSSDGVDGNSGVAGVALDLPASIDPGQTAADLARSDSLSAAARMGRPIIMPPTGNNLRDLYLVART